MLIRDSLTPAQVDFAGCTVIAGDWLSVYNGVMWSDLRHSYATAALADGVPVKVVSQRIGHADVAVTLKVYAHVMPGDDHAAALLADDLLGG